MLGAVLLLLALLHCQVPAINGLQTGQKYEVVYPEKLHSWHKRDTESKYPDRIQYKLPVEGKTVHLYLEKTEGLLTDNYTETSYLADGTRVTTSPSNQDHCCYQGHTKQDAYSLVTMCICDGLRGLIHTRNRRFLIEPLNQTDDGEHAIYEDNENTPRTCGVTNTTWTEGRAKSGRSGSNADKQKFYNSQKYVQLFLVADKTMFEKYNKSNEVLRKRIFEIINYVNEVYKQIGTFVALTGIEFWSNADLFEVSTSASINLDRFCTWRKQDLLPRQPHGNAQFITNTDFQGATVGLAYVATMCSESHSCGVIQDHSKVAISVGATVAHEMGHNLGMNHDTSTCNCLGESCIMAPSLSYNTPRLFSSCSISNFQDYIYNQMPMCMKNEPAKEYIKSPSVCGNKFTEMGEDCDCGTVKECANPCCDAATCQFKDKAQCADGECCENCKIKQAGTVCRPQKDDCDLPDMCTGKSPECPADRFIYNGHPCNDGQGFCYNGNCPSLEGQCMDMWGAGASIGPDSCFAFNKRGTNYGYCQQVGNTYVACGQNDIKCGVLYCSGGSTNPKVNAAVASISNCRAVLHPSGMVQNGTMCGEGMACFGGKCLDINVAFRSINCSSSCPGHGVCDHELQCQCKEGWAPPFCDTISETNIVLIVVVVLIALALILGIVLLLVFRKKFKRCGQKSPSRISGATNPAYMDQKRAGSSLSPPPPHQSRDGYSAPQYSVTTSVEPNKKPPAIQKPTSAPPPVPAVAPPPVPATKPVPATAPPPVPAVALPPVPATKPVPAVAPPPVPATKPVPAVAPPPVPATKPVPAVAPPPVPAVKPSPPTKALKPPVNK